MAFTDKIILTGKINPDLFDEIAMETAKFIAPPEHDRKNSNKNKSTQLRKYYDEILMWHQKINQDKTKYSEYLPLIKMINAKVAYAEGRNLVTKEFVELMRHCLRQLDEKEISTFENCKLFFEAFMGFYKVYKPQ